RDGAALQLPNAVATGQFIDFSLAPHFRIEPDSFFGEFGSTECRICMTVKELSITSENGNAALLALDSRTSITGTIIDGFNLRGVWFVPQTALAFGKRVCSEYGS